MGPVILLLRACHGRTPRVRELKPTRFTRRCHLTDAQRALRHVSVIAARRVAFTFRWRPDRLRQRLVVAVAGLQTLRVDVDLLVEERIEIGIECCFQLIDEAPS